MQVSIISSVKNVACPIGQGQSEIELSDHKLDWTRTNINVEPWCLYIYIYTQNNGLLALLTNI
jgi:hypothetical protein